MRTLWTLFITFCRIGGLTFGGGYAMLPMLEKEVVEKNGWASGEELMDYFAVGQCTPGVIAVNTATFVGYKQQGVWGAIAATAGVVFPSFVIVSIIAAFLNNFSQMALVSHALMGIRVAVGVLILNAVWKLWQSGVKGYRGAAAALVSFFVSVMFSVSPVYIVIAGALFGLWGGKKQ